MKLEIVISLTHYICDKKCSSGTEIIMYTFAESVGLKFDKSKCRARNHFHYTNFSLTLFASIFYSYYIQYSSLP